MSVIDISVGYAPDIIADYVSDKDNLGPSYSITTTNLGFSNNLGPSYSFAATGLLVGLPGFIDGKIIHYNVLSEVQGKLVFSANINVVPPTGVLWEPRGFAPTVVDNTTDRIISANESNSLNINTSAGSLVTLTLPPSVESSGSSMDFVRTSANPLRVAASGTDRIVLPTGDAGTVELTSIGTKLNLISNGITSWLSI
jgi:hypothetical protein